MTGLYLPLIHFCTFVFVFGTVIAIYSFVRDIQEHLIVFNCDSVRA